HRPCGAVRLRPAGHGRRHRRRRPGGDPRMTAVEAQPEAKEIGRDRRRKEDARLITGRTRWTDNITLNGMLHLAMVRSPFAHARITTIDTRAAEESTGVVAVLSGEDLADSQGVCINAWAITTDQVTPTHLP